MSNLTNEQLMAARNEAWVTWVDWEHEVYYPRWYKQHNQFINPWKDVDELNTAKLHRQSLFQTWLNFSFECEDRKLPTMPPELWWRWKEEQTPNGRRYVRE